MVTQSSLVRRPDLKDRLDSYIWNSLSHDSYRTLELEPSALVSANRLDVLARLAYLETHGYDREFAEGIYFETIRAQSDGAFKDPHDPSRRAFPDWVSNFRNLAEGVGNGFRHDGPLVPLARDGSILNGAHRVAIALFRGLKVPVVETELAPITADWNYLKTRGVSENHLLHMLYLFCKNAPDVFVAIFWPIAEKLGINPGMLETNDRKLAGHLRLTGSLQMVKNVAFEAYKEMNWIGTPADNFRGLDAKLALSAGNVLHDQSVIVSVFQEKKGLSEVREVKNQLRMCDHGSTRSVHITDNPEETMRLASLFFRPSGQDFLRLANPFAHDTRENLSALREKARKGRVGTDSFIVDGSTVLGLFGLREPRDLDVLCIETGAANQLGVEKRNEQLKYHEEPLQKLIRSPRFHFELDGLRIVSLDQVGRMKGNRQEGKDLEDLALIGEVKAGISSQFSPSALAKIRLFRVRLFKAARNTVRKLLRPVGLDGRAKDMYDRYFSRSP